MSLLVALSNNVLHTHTKKNECVCFSVPQAQGLGTKIINEDELLELIRTKPGKKSKYEIAAEAEVWPHAHTRKHTQFVINHCKFFYANDNLDGLISK